MRLQTAPGLPRLTRPGPQIAWFLTPTVSLADQQFDAIRAQTPGVQSKLITGSDNVQAWSTKPGVWDAVLLNTRIVVSTYQILFDAVTHALVPLSALSLIVIDEGTCL
jgi:superfamily II DNA/RNA helicase